MDLGEVRKALNNPSRAAKYLKRKGIQMSRNLVFKPRFSEVDVMKEDWDNLLLLDACRYDIFSKINSLDGELEYRISKGSNSPQFINNNFCGEYHDTIYVSGNPFLVDIEPGTFYDVVSVFDEWDSEIHTIPPEAVKDRALSVHQNNPNKRLIVHFMQPHIPYLGKTGDKIRREMNEVTTPKGWGHTPPDENNNKSKIEGTKESFAPAIEGVDITREDLRTAYRENLQIVLQHVGDLISKIDGKSVISADHGEHLGERLWPTYERVYDHPPYFSEELRKVPWLIVESGDRRKTVAEPQKERSPKEIEDREEKLRALGYR
jgi:hypothetical protein